MRIIGIMRVSVCLGAILIPEYLDFHSGYSAPRSRIAGIYSGIYSYSGISQTNPPLVQFMVMNSRSSLSTHEHILFKRQQNLKRLFPSAFEDIRNYHREAVYKSTVTARTVYKLVF